MFDTALKINLKSRFFFNYSVFLIVWCFCLTTTTNAWGFACETRIFTLPVSEVSSTLNQWLKSQPLSFTANVVDEGVTVIRLNGADEKNVQIYLRPKSALATEVTIDFSHDNDPSASKLAPAIWAYLKGYYSDISTLGEKTKSDIPLPVSRRVNAISCIQARTQGVNINLTGFIFDQKGHMLSTAHDLELGQKITAQFGNTWISEGRVTGIDFLADLAIIHIEKPPTTRIPLADSRIIPDPEEPLFSMNCSATEGTTIHTGSTDGFARKMNGKILWQVNLDVLHGNSGSPVLDSEGRLIGIVKGRFRGSENMGFLIPVSTIMDFVSENLL